MTTIQQQIVSATGQTFLSGSYQDAAGQMRNLLDNAALHYMDGPPLERAGELGSFLVG